MITSLPAGCDLYMIARVLKNGKKNDGYCQLRIKTALLLEDLSFKTALRVRMPPKEN